MTENKATKMEEDNSDGDVHAQLDRLDESLNNELDDLKKRIDLSEESTCSAKQIIDEGVASNDPDNPDVEEGDCSNDDNRPVVQPQPQSAERINHTDTTGKSNDISRRQRNKSQRGKRNDITKGDSRGNQQKSSTDNQKKQNQTRKQADEIANEDDENETVNVIDSSSTEKNKTQPARMEGRGRGSRRRRAQRRHQEQEKQQSSSDEPTSSCNEIPEVSIAEAESKENTPMTQKDDQVRDTIKPKAGPGEGKGRRARARKTRLRREQQKVNNDGAATESKKQMDNLSSQQKQRIMDRSQ